MTKSYFSIYQAFLSNDVNNLQQAFEDQKFGFIKFML